VTKLLELYLPLVGLVILGFILGGKVPNVFPTYLGQFLFWIGVPISIVVFLRQADLSGAIWLAPVVAWVAILLGAGLAWAWINWQVYLQSTASKPFWTQAAQGSFLLAAMVGNTGYLGYPVILAFVGTQYFGWALFYDLLGTTLGAYGLGVALAARFGRGFQSHRQLVEAILINPTLWSFGFGLGFRQIPLPRPAEQILQGLAWVIVALSLVLIGMRLSQLNSWHNLPRASISLGIKMLLVPLILGSSLSLFGLTGSPQLVIVLQMAMPPAFATLVIAEAYDLDRDLTVTALAVGSAGLLVTLPIWLLLFGRS
jgi:predicted permease